MKRFIALFLFILLIPVAASAGVMEVITKLPGGNALIIGAVTLVLGYILNQFKPDFLASIVTKTFTGFGITVTLGMSRWKVTKNFWNNIIEPWFISFIDNTVGAAVKGFIAGLKTDNPTDG
jgi:hypothetical protein